MIVQWSVQKVERSSLHVWFGVCSFFGHVSRQYITKVNSKFPLPSLNREHCDILSYVGVNNCCSRVVATCNCILKFYKLFNHTPGNPWNLLVRADWPFGIMPQVSFLLHWYLSRLRLHPPAWYLYLASFTWSPCCDREQYAQLGQTHFQNHASGLTLTPSRLWLHSTSSHLKLQGCMPTDSKLILGLGKLCQHNFEHIIWYMQHRSIFQHNTLL